MRQYSSDETSVRSPQNNGQSSTSEPSIHPVLRTALAHLDIQLEEELSRYRRRRLSRSTSRSASHNPSPKSANLIAVAATGSQPDASLNANLPSVSSRPNLSELQPSQTPELMAQVANSFASEMPKHSAAAPTIANSASDVISDPTSLQKEGVERSTSNPEISGLIRAKQIANADDYLESTEELLRSLAEEEAEIRAERSFMQSLLTPFGVGSMLLLLVSSAMLGYVLMNPAVLQRFLAFRQVPTQTAPAATSSPANGTASSSDLPKPNLAVQEFKDLSLETLSTVEVKPGMPSIPIVPSPQANPTAPVTKPGAVGQTKPVTVPPEPHLSQPSASTPTASTLRPSYSAPPKTYVAPKTYAPPKATYVPPSVPAPRRATVAPSPPTAPTKSPTPPRSIMPPEPPAPGSSPTSEPTLSSDAEAQNFRIVTHYEGDQTLEKARKVVPDAYVQNFPNGAKVQLGAYEDAAIAEVRAQELRNQGIPAEVYKR